MVVDSSPLVALLLNESDHSLIEAKSANDTLRYLSAVSLTETSNVMLSKRGDPGLTMLDSLLIVLAIQVIPVDREQTIIAREAFREYGKGRHRASLNFGDCFTYALAKQTGELLLFKGDDFNHTDLLLA
jgi:ribonuclease VapC